MVLIFKAIRVILEILRRFSLFSDEKKHAVCWMRRGEVILNQTIVSDVARLHLDFILCDDSLHLICYCYNAYVKINCI